MNDDEMNLRAGKDGDIVPTRSSDFSKGEPLSRVWYPTGSLGIIRLRLILHPHFDGDEKVLRRVGLLPRRKLLFNNHLDLFTFRRRVQKGTVFFS